MKKFKTAVVGVFALAIAATCLAACDNDSMPDEPKTLAAPEIVLNDDFSVSWQAVADATSYVVNVNGDDLKAQEALTFNALTAVNSYTVKVKAKNDEAVSDYSAPITYSVHGVTLGSGEGYELHGADTVYGGKDYTFTLEITSEAYEAAALAVKANDTLLTEADGKYTVKNVSSDLNITVSGVEKKTYGVTIPTGEGYTVSGAAKAVYGEDYSFAVAKAAGYDQSSLIVKVNGETVAEENGKYTVKNVKTALEITVEGAAKNQYAVTAPAESVAYTFTGNAKAIHGEAYTFTLVVKESYDTANLKVKANGNELTAAADGKTYTVENVTGAIGITVEGLNIRKYNVTLSAGDGYTLDGAAQAEHGGNYTFTLTLNEAYSNSAPTVKCNGNVLTEKDGKYTVENVTGALEITVENVELNIYTAKIAEGEGFTVTGDRQKSVNHGSSVQFTIAASNTSDVVKVFNGSAEVIGENGVYTLENVAADVTLTVKVYDLAAQLLLADNWDDYEGSTKAENAAENSITVRGWQFGISAAYIQKAVEAGYTHLRFDYALQNMSDETKSGIFMAGEGTQYEKCYSDQNTARFDLTALKKDGTYAKIWMQGRNAEAWGDAKDMSLTATNPALFKSTETASWNKDGRNSIYCAEEENGFIVLDTVSAGNDAHILSSTEWWAKYANNAQAGGVGQRTIILSGKYLYAGGNTRGALWGGASAVVSSVGGTANAEIVTDYLNNITYTEGNQFYYGLDKEGVYALNVNEFVSNRNSWGDFSFTYIDNNTVIVNLPNEGKIVNVNTQDYIEKGYTKCVITAGEYTGGQIWAGNDNWSGGMFGLNSGESKELDLAMFTENNPYLQVYCSGKATTVTLTYRFF